MQISVNNADSFVSWAIAIVLAFTLVLFVWELRTPLVQLDDAFISYHYAQNLVAGHGLVFNIDERVEGYTNLLWVLLVALGIKLSFAAPLFGHWLCVITGALLLLASYWYTAILLPRSARLLAAFAPLLLFTFNTFARWTSSGLEQGLFSALVVAALCAHAAGRLWLTCLMCALATLTRPEGALVAALLLNEPWLKILLRNQRLQKEALRSVMPALAFCAFAILMTLFRWRYYGDIVPNTFRAKVGGISLDWGLLYFRQFFFDGPIFLLPGTLLAAVLVPRFRIGFALLLAFTAYIFWVRGDVFSQGRFFLPVLPVMVTGGLLAIYSVPAGNRVATAIFSGLILLASYFTLYVQVPLSAGRYNFSLFSSADFIYSVKRVDAHKHDQPDADDRVLQRLQLIKQAVPPIRLFAAVGIGRIAYYGRDLPVLDLVGLTDKTIARSKRNPALGTFVIPGHQRSDPEYVFSRQPDLIDIAKKGAPPPILPVILDLWSDPRLEAEYHWDDVIGGYRRDTR